MRWGPRLGAFVEFADDETNDGTALFKTAEALSRGAFFFSTSVELKTKGAGGGGAGRERLKHVLAFDIDPQAFLAVSAICLERSDLT